MAELINNVLVISYFFPPLSGPGVQRAYNFVKNLKKSGWNPIVLTVKDIEYVSHDESLLSDLAEIPVYRTETLDPMRVLKLWQQLSNKGSRLYQETDERVKKLGRDIFPIDSKIGWLPIAMKKARKICRLNNVKVIFATMSPYSSGILAYLLSKATGIPYVLDYRDLWQGKPDMSYFSGWHKKLAINWEKKIISEAAAIIHVTAWSAKRFKEIYPECDPQKVSVIFNGYDADKFHALPKMKGSDGKIRFTFAGHFYGGQSPENFINVLIQMNLESKLNNAEICFAGNYGSEIEHLFERADFIKRIPYLSYAEYIDKLIESDVLLLFIASENSDMILTQKLFDYLAVRRPILAIVPENGEAAAIIRKYQAGIICAAGNHTSIKNGLEKMLEIILKNEEDKHFVLKTNNYSEFQRSRQAVQLAELMRSVINV